MHSLLFFALSIVGACLLIAFNVFQDYEEEALQAQSLGMVLLLGFLTGLHCIGMCGGFMLSYMKYGRQHQLSTAQMHVQYGVAKIISYSLFGALFGLLGSVVYFTTDFKANVSYVGGIFLVYIGAKGLGLFRNFRFIKVTQRLKSKTDRISHPIGVGLLNGFMISCAPLQALYLLSASLGDPLHGAILLAVFALGTLPIFLFYGIIVSTLQRFRLVWSDRISASIIIVFGILMLNRGMAFGGHSLLSLTNVHENEISITAPATSQTLLMTANAKGWGKSTIPFQYGTKIRWEIEVEEITMCNKTITIPQLGIEHHLQKGLNIIEFDPKHHKTLVYTCWMGMLTGKFVAE